MEKQNIWHKTLRASAIDCALLLVLLFVFTVGARTDQWSLSEWANGTISKLIIGACMALGIYACFLAARGDHDLPPKERIMAALAIPGIIGGYIMILRS